MLPFLQDLSGAFAARITNRAKDISGKQIKGLIWYIWGYEAAKNKPLVVTWLRVWWVYLEKGTIGKPQVIMHIDSLQIAGLDILEAFIATATTWLSKSVWVLKQTCIVVGPGVGWKYLQCFTLAVNKGILLANPQDCAGFAMLTNQGSFMEAQGSEAKEDVESSLG